MRGLCISLLTEIGTPLECESSSQSPSQTFCILHTWLPGSLQRQVVAGALQVCWSPVYTYSFTLPTIHNRCVSCKGKELTNAHTVPNPSHLPCCGCGSTLSTLTITTSPSPSAPHTRAPLSCSVPPLAASVHFITAPTNTDANHQCASTLDARFVFLIHESSRLLYSPRCQSVNKIFSTARKLLLLLLRRLFLFLYFLFLLSLLYNLALAWTWRQPLTRPLPSVTSLSSINSASMYTAPAVPELNGM